MRSAGRPDALVRNLPCPFAYHEPVVNRDGTPMDYVFVEVNRAFEEMTGLRREDLIGKTVTQVSSEAVDSNIDWRGLYQRAATADSPVHTEEFCAAGWYQITAYREGPGFSAVFHDTTAQKQAEARLRASRDRLSGILDNIVDVVWSASWPDLKLLYLNPAAGRLYGRTVQELMDDPALWQAVVHPGDVQVRGEALARLPQSGVAEAEYRIVVPDESVVWVHDRFRLVFDHDQVPIRVDGIVSDITGRKLAEEALLGFEERYRILVENANEGILVIQDGFYRYLNDKAVEILGHDRELLTSTPNLAFVHADDRALIAGIREQRQQGQKATGRRRFRIVTATGQIKWVETNSNVIAWRGQPGVLVLMTDITERLRQEEQIRYLSFHDRLTGLYNRAFFEEEYARAAEGGALPQSIIMIDVNGLKLVNDTFDHHEGDRLLLRVARALRCACRKEDIIARWGGDEFVILLPNTTSEQAASVCQRLHESVAQAPGGPVPLSISLGHATRVRPGDTRDLLGEAEEGMYRQKLSSRDSVHRVMITALRAALNERTHETEEHGQRLERLCLGLVDAIGLPGGRAELSLLAYLHDVGKIVLPDEIFTKGNNLSQEEWNQIKRHPEVGYRIASASPELTHIAEAVLSHHERWDGSGYPRGTKGEDIPLPARILAIADAYEAMTQGRPYRKAKSTKEARAELRRYAGSQFDPRLVEAFLTVVLPGIEDGEGS